MFCGLYLFQRCRYKAALPFKLEPVFHSLFSGFVMVNSFFAGRDIKRHAAQPIILSFRGTFKSFSFVESLFPENICQTKKDGGLFTC